MVSRIYVEKKPGFDVEAQQLAHELRSILGITSLEGLRLVNRYDVEGISQELFERADERPSSSFLYTLSIGAAPAFASYEDYLTDDKLFVFQSNTIRELAKQGPCVFIGRCADYVLRRQPGMLSVFIHAPLEQRVLRIAKLRNIDEDKARALIRKTDKTRANYYNYYADGDWGRADRYDLALNTGKLPIPVAAQLLADAAGLMK